MFLSVKYEDLTKTNIPPCPLPGGGILRNILRPIGDKNTLSPLTVFVFSVSPQKKGRDDSLLRDLLSIAAPAPGLGDDRSE